MSTETLRDKLAHALEIQFGSFLAHDPHKPAMFYGQAADSLMRLMVVEQAKKDAEISELRAEVSQLRVAIRACVR